MKLNNPKHASKMLAALGIDTIEGDYSFDGKNLKVKGKTDADIGAAEATLNIAALKAEDAILERNAKRASEYPPIEDQLDAIWKQIAKLKEDGNVLDIDAETKLGNIQAVKNKYK